MEYYFEKVLDSSMEEAVDRVTVELKREGFGVLTDIDVSAIFKSKMDVDHRPYRILGACNPQSAHKVIEMEPNIGLMLPCNVVVQEETKGKIKVSTIDPIASMMAVENPDLKETAMDIRDRLKRVIQAI